MCWLPARAAAGQALTDRKELETPGAVAPERILAAVRASERAERMSGAVLAPKEVARSAVGASFSHHRRHRAGRSSVHVFRGFLALATICSVEKNGELVGSSVLATRRTWRDRRPLAPAMNVEDWSAAFRTAAVVALGEREVYEISAWASTALGKDRSVAPVFRLRQRSPLSIRGDTGHSRRTGAAPADLDCDASFLAGDAASI